jgi:hypothetical protein
MNMIKSVGIITFHSIYNFGAVLQAYALRRVVAKLGYQSEIMDFQPTSMRCWLFSISRRIVGLKRNWKVLARLNDHLGLRRRFRLFFRKQMGLGRRPLATRFEDLSRWTPKYDVYLSGSDMIWNPCFLNAVYKECGRAYYLDFVKEGHARKVSYASSFGVTEIPDVHRVKIASMLGRFHALSSREEIGCGFIQQLTGQPAEHVLDPTFLLTSSEYDEVAIIPSISGPFVLIYPMEPSNLFCRLARKVVDLLKLPVVAVVPHNSNPDRFAFADKVVYDAGPAEFLGWMKAASFVCTNSFHGTCFSLIYRKSFLGVPDSGSNMRMWNLLQRFGLATRQMTRPEELHAAHPLLDPIDYASLEPRLQQSIEQSLDYLKRALA